MPSKPPSFPFYGQDYQTGTMTMTPAERGAYMDCLWHQWASGGVPADDMTRLAGAMRCSVALARKLWPALASKFERGEDGLWRNPRLEKVRAEKQRYHEAQRGNGGRGGRPRKPETQTKPTGFDSDNPRVPSGFPSSLSSVPNGTESTHATRPNPYAHAQMQAPNGRVFWEGPIFDIPDGWARKTLKASNGKAVGSDVVKFARALTERLQRDKLEAPTQGFLGWLDAEWAAYRQPAVSDGYRPASEWIEQNRKASEGSCSPEEARAILAEARAKMRPVAHG